MGVRRDGSEEGKLARESDSRVYTISTVSKNVKYLYVFESGTQ